VESKRGGGGYIRIIKVQLLDDIEKLETLIEIIGNAITEKDAFSILNTLFEENIISRNVAQIMAAAMEKSVYPVEPKLEKLLRANILKNMWRNLKYEPTR